MKTLFPNIKTLKQAKSYGVVTKGNSKILGSTFSTDPFQCKVGNFLAKIENSVCSVCYARKLVKVYPSARKSWEDNLSLFRQHLKNDNLNLWCEAIAYQINHISNYKKKKGLKGANLHRWFASGDLDSVEMLHAFVYIAKLLPHIKFWLPTRERGIIREFLSTRMEPLPTNLNIRLSDTKIDDDYKYNNELLKRFNISFSGVHTKETINNAIECPAINQDGNCNNCSMCWDNTVEKISYKKH